METLFGILLIVVTVMYSFRFFIWLWMSIKLLLKKYRFSVLRTLIKMKQNPKVFIWGGLIEHGFMMIVLIGSVILLLS